MRCQSQHEAALGERALEKGSIFDDALDDKE